MNDTVNVQLMKEAIAWGAQCKPIKDAIPKVGAIIAIGSEAIGRGRRGTGVLGDDAHAEWHALEQVKRENKETTLPRATLYTTLEPCTGEVRTRPHESCTELILRNQIKKVVVGILDPNQGVTGKGLSKLQESGVDVSLFPHELAQQVRVQNEKFIGFQQTLGAEIISPKNGEELRIRLPGSHAVRFTSVNPPASHHYLLSLKNGFCWPQTSEFRPLEPGVSEVDAYFAAPGQHTLHLVSAVDLGVSLVTYYRRVGERNSKRKRAVDAVWPKVNEDVRKELREVLKDIWPGIPMSALPKGLRSEAWITVEIVAKS